MGVPAATRTVLSHCLGGSKDDSVGPRDLVAPWGALTDQSIPTHQGSPQLSNVLAQFLGTSPQQPDCAPVGIVPYQLEGFNSSHPS